MKHFEDYLTNTLLEISDSRPRDVCPGCKERFTPTEGSKRTNKKIQQEQDVISKLFLLPKAPKPTICPNCLRKAGM